MKNRILFIFILILLFSLYSKVFASELCSQNGYTVATINGIFTNEKDARENKDNLKKLLKSTFNNQPLKVDFLYNPTHGVIIDLLDAVNQKFFSQNEFEIEDADFAQMLNDASSKVKTQKLLLIGHSQGNFYANTFYNNVIDRPGGVPNKSIGVYGVASPASYVAGGGRYLTSSTDSVINQVRLGGSQNVLKPNVAIVLSNENDNGHSFSGVYLQHQSGRIISDIKFSLGKLKNNDEKDSDERCIDPIELTLSQKIQKIVLASSDFVINNTKKASMYIADSAYNTGAAIGDVIRSTGITVGKTLNGLLANAVESLPDVSNLTTLPLQATEETSKELENIEEAKNEIEPEEAQSEEKSVLESESENEDENKTETSLEEQVPPAEDYEKEKKVHSGGGGGNNSEEVLTPEPESELTQEPEPEIESEPETEPLPEEILPPVETPEPEVIPPPEPEPEVILTTTTIDVNTTLTAGEYTYDNLVIKNNAILLLESDLTSAEAFKGVKITAKNITIEHGASISSTAKGYMAGPGTYTENYSGASHGGVGDRSISAPIYDSAIEPTDLGSGGMNYFRGGGAIRLIATDSFTNNGTVVTNGDVTSSGGSIFLTTKNLSGNGKFSANGGGLFSGALVYGSGGGGRIALYYETSSFTGTAEANGGCGNYDGFSATCAKNGTVGFFDTLNNNFLVNTSWRFEKNDSPFNFNKITFLNGAKVYTENGINITANEFLIDEASQFTLAEDQIINIPIISIDGGSTFILSGSEKITANTFSLKGNSILTILPEQTLSMTIPNINIEAGSSISANAKGYMDGPGAPTTTQGGASYGGTGYAGVSSSLYGSETEPVDFGSGGINHYRGGGVVKLVTDDTLTNNGTISANGDVTSSGGSVYITSKNILGNGVISANGGGSYSSSLIYGPGGGGRVALYYESLLFTGQIIANGANSYLGSSKAGTVKMIDTSIPVILEPEPEPIVEPEPEPILDPIPEPEPEVIPDPPAEPIPDNEILPLIASYTFNGTAGNITTNPTASNPISLVINTNENVDWVSVKIERESDHTFYKIFQDGAGCVDGTKVCTKSWNGLLSSGGLLQEGVYQIKLHIKDLVTGVDKFYDYLSSVINVVI